MTTILATRDENKAYICTDGVLNDESAKRHLFHGVKKAIRIGNFLVASAGCSILTHEARLIVQNFNLQGDSLSLSQQNELCNAIKGVIKYKQEAHILLWGMNTGYVISSWILQDPNNEKNFHKEVICDEIKEDKFAIGAGGNTALAIYKALLELNSEESKPKLLETSVKWAGDVVMYTHSKPQLLTLEK